MLKLRLFLIVSLCWAAAASAGLAQNVYNLPQVANGGGLIRTTFIGFDNGAPPPRWC